jgi:hypothetical protein
MIMFGAVVLKATTVHNPGRARILGLITTTGRRLTISGSRKPALKSHIKIVPVGGCSLMPTRLRDFGFEAG